jgi:hypothetical protein
MKSDLPLPIEFGTSKKVMAIFWHWLEACLSEPFQIVPFSLSSGMS